MAVDVEVPDSEQQTSGRLIYISKQRNHFGLCDRLEQGTPLRRLTWLLLLFLLLLPLCLLVYSKAPFNQVSSSFVERTLRHGDKKTNLPGVTICSQNPVNKDRMDYAVDADEYYSLLLQLWFLDMKRLQEEVPSIEGCDTLDNESTDNSIQGPFNNDTNAGETLAEIISNEYFTGNTLEDITGEETTSQSHSGAAILTTQSGSDDDFTVNAAETISIGGSTSQSHSDTAILTTQSGSNDDFTANAAETISIGGSSSQSHSGAAILTNPSGSNDDFTANADKTISIGRYTSQSHSDSAILSTQSGSNDDFTANAAETTSIGGSTSQNKYPESTTFAHVYSNLLSTSLFLSSEPILHSIYSSGEASVDGHSDFIYGETAMLDYGYSQWNFETPFLLHYSLSSSSSESSPSLLPCTPLFFLNYPSQTCFISFFPEGNPNDGYFHEFFNPFSFDLSYDITQDFDTFFEHNLSFLSDYTSWDLGTIISYFVTSKTSANQWAFDSFYLWWYSHYLQSSSYSSTDMVYIKMLTYIDKILNYHRDIEWDVSTFLDYYYGSSRDPLLQFDTLLSNMISQSPDTLTSDWEFTTFYLWFFSFFSPTYKRLDFDHSITMTLDDLLEHLSLESGYVIDRDWDWTSFMYSFSNQIDYTPNWYIDSFDPRWQFDTFYLWWFNYVEYIIFLQTGYSSNSYVYLHDHLLDETFFTLWRSNSRLRGASPISTYPDFTPETDLDISNSSNVQLQQDSSASTLDAKFKRFQEERTHDVLPQHSPKERTYDVLRQHSPKDVHFAGRNGRSDNSVIKELIENSKLYDLSDISTWLPWTYDLLRDPDLAFNDDIYSCTLDGLPCKKKHFHLWKHQRYGNCYTFVGDQDSENNPTFHKQKAVLKIALQQASSESGSFMGSGYHLMIHEPTEFSAQNGINMEIVEDMEMTITQKQQKELPGHDGQCLSEVLDKQFSSFDCREECEDTLLQDECGCSQLMETSEDRLCTSDDMTCVMDFKKNHESDACQNCLPRCTEVTYEVEKMTTLSKRTDNVNLMRYLLKDEECSELKQLTESDLMELQIYLEPKKVEISADCTLNVDAIVSVAVAVYLTIGLSIISLVALLIEFVVTVVKTKSISSICQTPNNLLVQAQ